MSAPRPPDDDALLGYVAVALEMREQGIEPPLAEICRAHPALMPRVEDALRAAARLTALDRQAQDVDALRGRVVGRRYRLEARIGAGAMGVVYQATDLDLGRSVAVKILQTQLFDGPEAEARFAREAEVMAALRHPSVVTVFDRGRSQDGLMFLVMELLDGAPLGHLLADLAASMAGEPVPDELTRLTSATAPCVAAAPADAHQVDGTGWLLQHLDPQARVDQSWLRQAVSWAADLAAGLHAAHAAGIFHRDVKPSNVFIDRAGHAKLLDFGIAARATQATLANRVGASLGTPAYMAPEQLSPDAAATAALDVYGLTATLYHLLTLRPPYQGTPSQVIASLQRRDPVPAQRLRRGLPRDLQAILDCGMARAPGQRYGSAAALEADLRRFLAYQPVSVRPVTGVGRLWRRARRSPTVGALALVLVLAAGVLLAQHGRTRARQALAHRYLAAWSPLPPAFALSERLVNRVVTDPQERQALTALLDEAVATASEALPARLYRAAFRLDHGDSAGAADDMTAVATAGATPFAMALAACYRALPPQAEGARALDLRDLPEPAAPRDRYLAAYHAIRASYSAEVMARARAWLDVMDLASWAPAQELLMLTLLHAANLARGDDWQVAIGLYRRVHETALRLESMLGRRTASTAHLVGAALVGQDRFAEALIPLRDGVALSPWSHALRINLGIALRRTGALEDARACFEQAITLRPAVLEPYRWLARVHVDRGAFDAARACITGAPFLAGADGDRDRLIAEGLIEFSVAIAHLNADRMPECRAAAALAADKLRQAGPHDRPLLLLSEAIVRGDKAAMFELFLAALRDEPTAGDYIANLARVLPETLDPEQTEQLAEYLRELSRRLSAIHILPF